LKVKSQIVIIYLKMSDLLGREAKSAPLKTDKRFHTTKTGLIGVQRDTMLMSELQHLVNETLLMNIL